MNRITREQACCEISWDCRWKLLAVMYVYDDWTKNRVEQIISIPNKHFAISLFSSYAFLNRIYSVWQYKDLMQRNIQCMQLVNLLAHDIQLLNITGHYRYLAKKKQTQMFFWLFKQNGEKEIQITFMFCFVRFVSQQIEFSSLLLLCNMSFEIVNVVLPLNVWIFIFSTWF